MATTAYRYNHDRIPWMHVIAKAWAMKTDASREAQDDIMVEWRLGSIKLMVEYDLLVEVAVERGLIESDEDYNSPK
jgi:hypothetical protein